jgi:hypothetical protein
LKIFQLDALEAFAPQVSASTEEPIEPAGKGTLQVSHEDVQTEEITVELKPA